MYKIYGQKLLKNARVYYILCITLGWLVGLAVGVYLCRCNAHRLYTLFRCSASDIHSAVGSTIVFLFPLALSLIAASFSVRWLLTVVAFCRGLSFGFVACGLFLAFGGAGWLVCGLVMLPNAFLSAVLLWFLVRREPFESANMYWDAAISAALAFTVCVLFQHFTTPFFRVISQF